MAIWIREACLDTDAPVLISLAREHLTANSDGRRFAWLYTGNPFGRAQAWLAYDDATAAPIGMAAVFPRAMYLNGEGVSAGVFGDFCVHHKYRTLGPALELLRACVASVRAGQLAFCYDFPSRVMASLYKRLGIQPGCNSVRLAKLLVKQTTLAHFLRNRWLSGFVASLINRAATIRWRPHWRDLADFAMEAGTFNQEYTDLAIRVASGWGDCTMRTAEYLNWRYVQHPFLKFETMSARYQGELLAYCVLTVSGGSATIVDFFGVVDDVLVSNLLQKATRLLLQRGVESINFPVVANPLLVHRLSRMGFCRRELAPVVICGGATPAPGNLFLVDGDRES